MYPPIRAKTYQSKTLIASQTVHSMVVLIISSHQLALVFSGKKLLTYSITDPEILEDTQNTNKNEVLFYNNDNLEEEVVIIPDPDRVIEVE